MGQVGRGRAQGGERPLGAAACGGKGFKGRARVSGERPVGAASCRQQYNELSCQPPPPPPAFRLPQALADFLATVFQGLGPSDFAIVNWGHWFAAEPLEVVLTGLHAMVRSYVLHNASWPRLLWRESTAMHWDKYGPPSLRCAPPSTPTALGLPTIAKVAVNGINVLVMRSHVDQPTGIPLRKDTITGRGQ